jgi:hypothetical protein
MYFQIHEVDHLSWQFWQDTRPGQANSNPMLEPLILHKKQMAAAYQQEQGR